MADNVAITAGSGTSIAADEVVDATLGTVKVGYVKLMDGTLDGTTKAAVGANGLAVDVKAAVITSGTITTVSTVSSVTAIANALPAGTNAIGKLAANSGVDIGDTDVTSVIPGTGATNLGKAIDTATGGTDTGVLSLATRDDALGALTPIEGDNVQLRVDANGALWTHDDALDAALAGSELQVDVVAALPAGTNAIGKLAANSGVDIGDVDITSIAAGDNNIGNVDIVTLPALAAGTNNIGDVDVLTIPGIVGTVADDATTPGNPVMIGGKAVETDGTDPTSVSSEDDVAIVRTDRNRRMLVNTAHPNLWSGNENNATAQTNNAIKAAPGAGLSLYITDIIISNGATAGTVKIVTDTAGTPADVAGPYYFAANGGMSKRFATPIRIAANKDVGYTSVTVTTHTLTIVGYTAP